jgi:hypothetical protein
MKIFKMLSSALVLPIMAIANGCLAGNDPEDTGTTDVNDGNEVTQDLAAQPYCVTTADAFDPTATSPADVVPAAAPVTCFATLPAAISAATDGRVRLAASATNDTLDDHVLNGDLTAANTPFVIGIEYLGAPFQQPMLIVKSATPGCARRRGFKVNRLTGRFNNAISAAQAFSHCNNAVHFDLANENQKGAHVNCGGACRFIGAAMNDRTTSIEWTM